MNDRELMQMALDALMMCNAETMYASQRAAMARLSERLSQWDALDKMVAENERLGLYDLQGGRILNVPSKREWVGLTNDEISSFPIFEGLIYAIEAKLKEKNT